MTNVSPESQSGSLAFSSFVMQVLTALPAAQVGVLKLPRESLQALLTKAFAREWTPAQQAILNVTEGVESVRQAVRRVGLGTDAVSPRCSISR